jgi:serine/threonine protein kinase
LSVSQQRAAVAEVLLLQRVSQHPHVIRYHTSFVDDNGEHLWMVMEVSSH